MHNPQNLPETNHPPETKLASRLCLGPLLVSRRASALSKGRAPGSRRIITPTSLPAFSCAAIFWRLLGQMVNPRACRDTVATSLDYRSTGDKLLSMEPP